MPTSPPRHAAPTGDSREFVARLKAARDGARTPRGELLQRCRGYLLAVAQRRLPPDLRAKVGASDLAQEALTKAHANFERFTGESERELLAWLSRILEYSLYTVERRFRGTNKRNVAREVPLEGNSGSAGVPLNLAGDSPSPDSAAAAREEQLRLVAKLAQLRPADREIIELRNLQALSFAEIARRQGRDPDTVRKHWARALDRLSNALDD